MSILIRPFEPSDLRAANEIWNQVVQDGVAFPQLDFLDESTGLAFFCEQTFTRIAVNDITKEIVGLYILHPNNIGRCGHICNASYAVKRNLRGQKVGEKLITHCLLQAKKCDFKILQFNAVVANNFPALHLYEKLGFVRLGTIPNGFLYKDGTYKDIIPHYIEL